MWISNMPHYIRILQPSRVRWRPCGKAADSVSVQSGMSRCPLHLSLCFSCGPRCFTVRVTVRFAMACCAFEKFLHRTKPGWAHLSCPWGTLHVIGTNREWHTRACQSLAQTLRAPVLLSLIRRDYRAPTKCQARHRASHGPSRVALCPEGRDE